MPYKRNQVETAIGRVVGSGSAKPGSEIRTRLKRLLETDRGLGRSKRSADPERANFAFYDMDPPGRGVEIWFSDYEAFALLTGLRVMQHGWPQGFSVAVLRHVRPELEAHHDRVPEAGPGDPVRPAADYSGGETRGYRRGQHRSCVSGHHFDGHTRPLRAGFSCNMPRAGGVDGIHSGKGGCRPGLDHVRTGKFSLRSVVGVGENQTE